ncbi:outer membrane beta-barrel protein [Rudanella paleaurantiibacter]|uniref:Outer membrane beta-barrel protein n=1 Tax=Rudanella paleaurantiibacter TaxID=2614655 RepID=A0A7J5TZ65_9BACT|nr:outer membrane beta-barrel family protein [Rudanella paleaurantiibacter]KAB7730438.1 outer membrane beta-barrel protein [Rudanella paleaurantiibacter]
MRLLLLFTILLASLSSFAQNRGIGTIRASVLDSTTKQGLPEATVSLLRGRDSSLVTFQVTGGEGEFMFRNVAEGPYQLLITYVGYQTLRRNVTITAAEPTPNLGPLYMATEAKSLNEVTVQGAPVVIKGDTLEFNAGSFKTQPNAVVEDLIKKLPGMEVERDGTVKAQGQEVKRILVDGKPFFGNDPKMATRNLPAEMIDKVQLYDRQSEQSQFSGVDDGDREKTINITTKRDRRKGVFGRQSLGMGQEPPSGPTRYQGQVGINRFDNGQQLSVIGSANNINQQNFSAEGLGNGGGLGGFGGGNNFGGGGMGGNGGNRGGQGGNSGGNSGLPTGQQTNLTRAISGGLNFSDGLTSKVDFSASYFYNNTRTITEQTSRRENILPSAALRGAPYPDSTNITNRQSSSVSTFGNHRVNAQLIWRIDSMNTLRVIPNLVFSDNVSNSLSDSRTASNRGTPLNSSLTNYDANGRGVSGTNTLLWTHKFKRRGRTFSANLNTTLNSQVTNGFNRSKNEYFQSITNIPLSSSITGGGSLTGVGGLFAANINQRNEQQTDAMTSNLNLSYTEPLSLAKTLEFRYNLNTNDNSSDRQVFDFDERVNAYTLPNERLTNRFDNIFRTQRAGVSLQTRRLKYNYTFGFDVQDANLQTNNISRDIELTRYYLNLLPNALFTYNVSRNQRLMINYRSRIQPPSVNQLQPVLNNSNPLNIQTGNPDLKPEFANTLNINYNNFDPTTFRSLFASINVNQINRRIVNATAFNSAGGQVTKPVNADGYYSITGFLNLGRSIDWSGQRVNLSWATNGSFVNNISFVNDQLNKGRNLSVGQRVSINTFWKDKLDLNLSGNVSYQSAQYSLQPQQNSNFLFTSLNAFVFYQLPGRFTLTSDFSYNANSGRAAGFNQRFALWNVGVAKQLFKQKQGELRLSVYDLLNQNRSIIRNVNDTYIEDVQSLVLRRYVMLTFTYNLRKFGMTSTRR